MLAFFKKRRSAFSDNRYYLFVQDKWAKKMTALTTGLSKERWIVLLVLFVVVTLSMLIGVLVYEVDSKVVVKRSVGSLSRLVAPEQRFSKAMDVMDSISRLQEERLFEYSLYLEYLAKKAKCKASDDSVQNVEVELDSLVVIENDYKYNFKK